MLGFALDFGSAFAAVLVLDFALDFGSALDLSWAFGDFNIFPVFSYICSYLFSWNCIYFQ